MTSLSVVTKSDSESLQFGVDESYNLSISLAAEDAATDKMVVNFKAVIQASTVFGALRGLESFAQLIDWQGSSSNYVVKYAPLFMSDTPRFPWR